MIKVKDVFFCDEFQIAQHRKLNIIGMLPSRIIEICCIPYMFISTLIVDCIIEEGEYNSQILIKIIDEKHGGIEIIEAFTLKKVFEKTGRVFKFNHLNIFVASYVSMKIVVEIDGNEGFCETFQFRSGDSPVLRNNNLLTMPTSGIIAQGSIMTNAPKILVSLADKEVFIIDQYITSAYLRDLFSDIHHETMIKILTGEQNLSELRNLDLNTFNNTITIKASPKISERFHDRFIIINETEIYHLGYSLKDLGKQISRYSKLIEVNEVNDFSVKLKSAWDSANIVVG